MQTLRHDSSVQIQDQLDIDMEAKEDIIHNNRPCPMNLIRIRRQVLVLGPQRREGRGQGQRRLAHCAEQSAGQDPEHQQTTEVRTVRKG